MIGTEQAKIDPRTYSDATVELRDFSPDTDTYIVNLSGPAVGELKPSTVSLAYSDLEDLLLQLEDGGVEEEEDLIGLGAGLADRLLPEGEIRTRLEEAFRGVGPDGGIRLRLLIREPRLAQLPWEYTYLRWHEGEAMSHFLVLDPKVSMVRHEAIPAKHPSVTPKDPERLGLVFAMANVSSYPELDLRMERRTIEKALKDLPADGARIDYGSPLVDPTVPDLQAALLRGADIFHFAGHGGFDPGGDGYLVFPPEVGSEAERLPAATLALHLRQAGVQLAVLGACESGRRDGVSPWAGVAPALVGQDIPVVLAMQYRVPDTSAIKFSRAFYTALALGLSVDEAVSAGRLAIFDPDDSTAPWGIPVLYMRSANGVIFPHLAERASAAADALRTVVKQVVETIEETGRVTGIKMVRGAGAAGNIEVSMSAGVVKGEILGIEELDLREGRQRGPDPAD